MYFKDKISESVKPLLNSKGVATMEYAIVMAIFVLGSLAAVAQTGAAIVKQFERSHQPMSTERPMGQQAAQGEGEPL